MVDFAKCQILIVAVFALSSVAAIERLPPKYSEFKVNAFKLVDECAAEHNVDKQTIENAIDNDTVQNLNPCFLGCVFEKAGLINEKGYGTPDVASARLQKYVPSPKYEKISDVLKQCSDKVNAESPKDTCESGRLFAPCLVDAYVTKYNQL